MPEQVGVAPSYEQKPFDLSAARGNLYPIASRQGKAGVVRLHQDAVISVAVLERGESLCWRPSPERYLWLQMARGAITLNQHALSAGDGAGIDGNSELQIQARQASEILLFDLA